jgi:hypothetical protein
MSDLLSSVIAAHGGLDRWRTVRAIDVTFNFSGGLLDIKGFPGHRRPSASVDVATPRTVFQRLGDESDERWIFTPNRVWIERRDGTVVEERSDPRAAFGGHVRETPWDRLHLAYFLGYAVWNYLSAPFLFARTGFTTRELESHVEGPELRYTHPRTGPDVEIRPRPAQDADGPTPRIQQTLKKWPATDPKVPATKRLSTGAALALNRGDDPENRVSV